MKNILKNDNESLILDTRSHHLKVNEQMKREAIITYNHSYSIWVDKNGRWQTYLPIVTGTRKIKLISSASKEKLEKRICDFYNNKTPTFEQMFYDWIERRLELKQIAPSTYTRYECDYKRYCKDTIGQTQINMLTIEDYVDFMDEQIAKFDLEQKAFWNLKGILKGTINRAKKLHYIDFSGIDAMNEFEVVSEATLRKVVINDEDEVYDEEETILLMDRLAKSEDSMDICLLLLFVSGLRVGEAVTLKPEDLDCEVNTVHVCKTERRYNLYHCPVCEVVNVTKTINGLRTVVIPTEFNWLIRKICDLNPTGEFCFIGERGKRLTATKVERRLRIVCKELGIPPRPPHKIRKTYLSILLDNHIDQNMIIQQAGHSSILTTEKHYHRNRKSIERKRAILDSIPDFNLTQSNENPTQSSDCNRLQ